MKKYFEEKKRSLRFKLAGPGHKLSEQSGSGEASSSREEAPKRVDTEENQEQRRLMLDAITQRSQPRGRKPVQKKPPPEVPGQSSSDTGNAEEQANMILDEEDDASAPGVFFKCPALDDTLILSRPEWEQKIKAHITELKEIDVVLASILQIKSLSSGNGPDECIILLTRYLRNIIDNPDADKYRSIRMGNPKFTEVILSVDGALDFLLAVGFEIVAGENSENYLKFNKDTPSELEVLIASLLEISGFNLELDRDFHMYEPKDLEKESTALPDDFFEITIDDIKRQQQQRTTQLARESILMTKKMREMEKAKYARRKALYTRIRVRLPNDLVLQGTFSVKERFHSLLQFINEHIEFEAEYSLMSPPSHVYDDKDLEKTLDELNLHPAVQLILKTSSETMDVKVE